MESSEGAATTGNGIHPEFLAIEELTHLIKTGKARDVLNTYSFCKQSCDYVYGIVRTVAYEESDGISEDVKNFAKNLLDDWSK